MGTCSPPLGVGWLAGRLAGWLIDGLTDELINDTNSLDDQGK